MMIFLIMASLLVYSSPAEVDNLNILLPELEKPPLNLPLQLITAQDGCYHWKSSQPDIVSVSAHLPKSTGCSRQAIVSVAQVGKYPSSIYVSADEAESESSLKIPVRIRKLNKISIFTKSRMMNIKEIQRLQLFAFDSDSNTFTSLEGMRFKWRLQQASQIIELVPLRNAHLYLPLKTRENLQQHGYQSDMIVVRAQAPGNLKVTATCIEPGYEHLYDEITISVHERFQLQPGPLIRMAPETSLQLRLVRPTMQEIHVPQSYYRIISCDGFQVNSTLYLTVPDRPSRCTLKVQDIRTKPPFESSVDIIVETADELKIITNPLVIVDKESQYQVQLFKDGVPLLGESKKVQMRSEFELNQNKKTLIARKKTTGILSAQLGILKKQITITSLLPVTVLLPDDYLHLPVGEHFKLRLLGGTGVYDFEINQEVATINSVSILNAKAVGDVIVTIRDRNHLANLAIFRLKVSQLTEIQSLEAQKEVNRDEWGSFYVIGRNLAHETFTQCNHDTFSLTVPTVSLDIDKKVNQVESLSFLHFHQSKLVQQALLPTSLLKGRYYQIVDSYSRYVKENEIDSGDLKNYILSLQNFGICKIIRFKSIIAFEDNAAITLDGQEDIDTLVPLRVYNHVVTTIEEEGENSQFLMTPESTLGWKYTGGSYHWPESNTNVYINSRAVSDNPTIRCQNKQTPSQPYKLKIENNQTRKLLFPTSQTATINIICKFPKKLHLNLEHGQAFDQLFIEPHTEVKGKIEVSDEFNQIFYNASNVKYQFSSRTGTIKSQDRDFGYRSLGINDTISIYTETLKTGLHFKRVSIHIVISVVQPITLVHPLGTEDRQKNITIIALYTPKKPYIINIKDFHSQVYVQCTKAVSCEKGENYLAVKLLKIGTGHVVIRDKKIYGCEAWNFEFIIVEMDEVRVAGDRDYLQEGQLIEVNVTNYYRGQAISPFTYQPSYLQLIIHRNLRVVEQRINTFIVKAEQGGEYEIYGENTYPHPLRSKEPLRITVYRRITPNIEEVRSVEDKGFLTIEAKTAIVVGCRRLVRVDGGPKEIFLSFKPESSNLKVNSIGNRSLELFAEKEGIYEMVINVHYKSSQIARITVTIFVSRIESIELQSIDEPVQGAQFRVQPRFRIGTSYLEESICDFVYHWSVANNNVRLGESMSLGFIDGAGVNATALRPGDQVISLQVTAKHGKEVVGKISKPISILHDVRLSLPTYVDRATSCTPVSVLIPPSTRYSFDSNLSVSVQSGLLSLGSLKNQIQSGKKLGHTTISLTRPGYRPLFVEVEVKQVDGLFINNAEGFMSIEPQSTHTVPLYIQDNTGRLFVTPLQHLELIAVSSNSDILEVELNQDNNALRLRAKGQGICVVSVMMPGRNILDNLVVSIGSALTPARFVRVLLGGTIHFSSSLAKDKWVSSQPEIARVDPSTGQLTAIKTGYTKITNGQLSSTVQVLRIAKISQVDSEKYKGSSIQTTYQVLWQGKDELQELPNLGLKGAINNNFQPKCIASNKYLIAQTSIVVQNGFERIRCVISAAQKEKLPEKVTIVIKDNTNSQLGEFTYQVKPHFTLEKNEYALSASSPKDTIKIKTSSQLNVSAKGGKPDWIHSLYDEKEGLQTLKIDMKEYPVDVTWWVELSCPEQSEEVKIAYVREGGSKGHSFWSFNLDWPDYLILLMTLVIGTICYIQYSNEEKLKNS